jgi:hypothetical protein
LALNLPNAAHAYIDPATTSYLIQVVSGVVITLSVAIGVFFRRLVMGLTTLRARAAAWWAVASAPGSRELRRRQRLARAEAKALARSWAAADGAAARETPPAAAARREAERLLGAGLPLTGPAFGAPAPDLAAVGGWRAGGGRGDGARAVGIGGFSDGPDCWRADGAGGGRLDGIGGRTRGAGGGRLDGIGGRSDLAVSKGRFWWGDRRSFRRRLGVALPAGLAGPFLFFGFGFLDLYLRNSDEFPFGFAQLAGPSLLLAAALGLVVALVLLALRGRVFDAVVSVVLGLALAAWTQANFLNIDYGELNGVAIRWERYARLALADTLAWLVLVSAPLVLRLVSRRVWNVFAWLAPVAVIAAGNVGLVSVYSQAEVDPWRAATSDYPTYEGLFTASSTANQYIFVLDMMDQKFVQEIEAEEPDFFASHLDGFTQFDNHISNYTRTLPSTVDMLTGQRYQFDEPQGEYMARAYQDGSFLPALRRAGYSTNIYATNRYSYSSVNDIKGLADNVRPAEIITPTGVILRGFARLAGFRYAPHVLKPTFWTPVDPFRNSKPDASKMDPFSNGNLEFHRRLKAGGVVLDGPRPRFSFIHLDGAHNPARINADAEPVEPDSVSLTEQAKGAFKIVFDYLDELKRLGRYKDATIVITADHGHWLEADYEELAQPRLTALFVKPAGAEGTRLAHSDAPTEMANVRAALLEDAGAPNLEGAPSAFEVDPDSTAPRDFFYRRGQNVDEGLIDHWQVTGDARDFANWHFKARKETAYWG